jgi:hypothetical protein
MRFARVVAVSSQLPRLGLLADQLVERLGILALLFWKHALRERDQPVVAGAGLAHIPRSRTTHRSPRHMLSRSGTECSSTPTVPPASVNGTALPGTAANTARSLPSLPPLAVAI